MNFDDIEARPGSVSSRLRTLIGLYLRRLGGWISAADLVQLMGDLGVADAQARTGIARLKTAGLMIAQRRETAGYRLNPSAEPMLNRGDRRIFSRASMAPDEHWCLLSFSIPESHRAARHQLRKRLQWLGCGAVAPALWISRGAYASEIELTLDELQLREYATVFFSEDPRVSGTLAEAVSKWWDLDAISAEHTNFLAVATASAQTAPFRRFVDGVDAWRVVPYADPGLPTSLLPEGWIGEQSAMTFAALRAQCEAAAWAHVQRVVTPSSR